jgi:AraC-like DNA-binding protein
VQRERIATAKNMLKYSDYTAQQIATALGFSSQSYFTKVFRQTTGHTPTDYRRRYHHSTGFGE